jgi:ectoine hydroxylase-related dioxygenase (phytanoyl-CoA dioxygenase family)
MDLLKKLEVLIAAKSRAGLPRRERHSILDEAEAGVVAEIRRALGEVQVKEQELAGRIQQEQAEAQSAHERGDIENHMAHSRRAVELEHHLEQESIFAINLEDKLAELEAKLARAQAAVEREAQNVTQRDAAASDVLSTLNDDPITQILDNAPPPPPPAPKRPGDVSARKSRLSE